jgi:hypothetical protein
MPHDSPPNWRNVAWDHRASDEAIAALRRAAGEIERALDEDARRAQGATAEWRGQTRADFDQRRGRLRDDMIALAADCRAAAEQVYRAAADAADEQRRREEAREAWERDQRRRGSGGD